MLGPQWPPVRPRFSPPPAAVHRTPGPRRHRGRRRDAARSLGRRRGAFGIEAEGSERGLNIVSIANHRATATTQSSAQVASAQAARLRRARQQRGVEEDARLPRRIRE